MSTKKKDDSAKEIRLNKEHKEFILSLYRGNPGGGGRICDSDRLSEFLFADFKVLISAKAIEAFLAQVPEEEKSAIPATEYSPMPNLFGP